MPDDNAPPPRQRRPRGPALSAARITGAAMDLIDAEGLDAFSFRTLAARLGCQAMSIYNYFPSKTHLYEALVDICAAEALDFDDSGPWRDRLRAAAGAYRRMALNHPGFFLYFGIFRLNNTSGMTFLNRILTIYQATGLPDEARARHFRIMGYYLVGACIDETLGYAKGPSATDPVPVDVARARFPAIMAVGPYFGTDRHKATFEAGVEMLIAAIEAEISLPPHPDRSGM
jgi:AcrR family transcriptional regulator